MRNTRPTLEELPPAPLGKASWPWTEASARPSDTLTASLPWPRISIITPSYNQGEFLEEALRSVLLQGYPNLEYFVIDGGSTDNSLEIIHKYARWLTGWVSEPDRGQAHAINKGFALCTGALWGWINSDDGLLPGALTHLAAAFRHSPESILLGDVLNIDDIYKLAWLRRQRNVSFETLAEPGRHNVFWQQPGVYFPRTLYQRVGKLDETLRYVFDRDWMCRALQVAPVHYLHVPIAMFRLHDASKTVHESTEWDSERRVVAERYRKQNEDIKTTEAALSMYLAAAHLHAHTWNKARALKHLRDAIRHRWLVLSLPKFWCLCFKATLPLGLLKILRALRSQFFSFSSSSDTGSM